MTGPAQSITPLVLEQPPVGCYRRRRRCRHRPPQHHARKPTHKHHITPSTPKKSAFKSPDLYQVSHFYLPHRAGSLRRSSPVWVISSRIHRERVSSDMPVSSGPSSREQMQCGEKYRWGAGRVFARKQAFLLPVCCPSFAEQQDPTLPILEKKKKVCTGCSSSAYNTLLSLLSLRPP